MDKYENTHKTWNLLAQKYQDIFMDLKLYDESYDTFCEMLEKKNAHILELGCGPGNVTKYLLNKCSTYKIHATDIAPSMVALAKINNPTANCEVIDTRQINQIKNKYDAIVCGFCLPYLDKEDCINLIKDSFQLLQNEGLIYVSMIEGDYNNSILETSSDGLHSMLVYYYSQEFITNIFMNYNFNIDCIFKIPYTKSNGEQSTHLIFIARKTNKIKPA
jgi:ubiquinone/menaquinone biosynthesis C-methylase UbiE